MTAASWHSHSGLCCSVSKRGDEHRHPEAGPVAGRDFCRLSQFFSGPPIGTYGLPITTHVSGATHLHA
jgi:hypothetical protein